MPNVLISSLDNNGTITRGIFGEYLEKNDHKRYQVLRINEIHNIRKDNFSNSYHYLQECPSPWCV